MTDQQLAEDLVKIQNLAADNSARLTRIYDQIARIVAERDDAIRQRDHATTEHQKVCGEYIELDKQLDDMTRHRDEALKSLGDANKLLAKGLLVIGEKQRDIDSLTERLNTAQCRAVAAERQLADARKNQLAERI